MTCIIEQGDAPFEITWAKDNEVITSSSRYGPGGQVPSNLKLTTIDAHSSMIVFERLAANHAGNYTCRARNSVAEVSHTAELVVRGTG